MSTLTDHDISRILLYVLLGFYGILTFVSFTQLVRFTIFLRGLWKALKIFYFFVFLASVVRSVQMILFGFENYHSESKTAYILGFFGCVFYFSGYMFLVFYWMSTYMNSRKSSIRSSSKVHRGFVVLAVLYYVLCIAFIVVILTISMGKSMRFVLGSAGLAVTSLLSFVAFSYFGAKLYGWFRRSDHYLSRSQRRSLRKICFITVVCSISFFLRFLFLVGSCIKPDTFQGTNASYEFGYYMIVEIIPTVLMLMVVGTVSNEKLRKMQRKKREQDSIKKEAGASRRERSHASQVDEDEYDDSFLSKHTRTMSASTEDDGIPHAPLFEGESEGSPLLRAAESPTPWVAGSYAASENSDVEHGLPPT
eukprot:TRINITY_DN3513_c0_g1_i1.p1 TRINITY_DN3513_c0_g1~~TRINITY_DN3513_c0_g1_i1.p1  ORF type:complete len:364 (-),score=32.99 TRINITY_DN3513_c0_g1_i1:245-1336(-)